MNTTNAFFAKRLKIGFDEFSPCAISARFLGKIDMQMGGVKSS